MCNGDIHLVGNLYITEEGINQGKYGVGVISRSQSGQGWGFDLKNISPNDLRVLADYLDERLEIMEKMGKKG